LLLEATTGQWLGYGLVSRELGFIGYCSSSVSHWWYEERHSCWAPL